MAGETVPFSSPKADSIQAIVTITAIDLLNK